MSKILIISGPTASGKTSQAAELAKKFNGELISADSRQIYIGMDIGTGKDHPQNIPLHLIDIIYPNQSFSAAQYRNLALAKIKEIQSRGKIAIIVGGTGQYIDSLINPQPTFSIKPNPTLRFILNKLPLSILQDLLRISAPTAYKALNNSDLHNPHRLIRKIEIALSPKKPDPISHTPYPFLHLSLTAPNQFLYDRIDTRIEDRLKLGLIAEIKNLLKIYKWSDPGLNTLAYKEFKNYFNQKYTLKDAIQTWKYDEHAYARRQKTWFKKMSDITFIDITQPGYEYRIINLVSNFISP